MKTIFWKFSFDEDIDSILSSKDLFFPDLKKWPHAKNNSVQNLTKRLRVGNYVLLANFNKITADGTVLGAGYIEDIQDGKFVMNWKRVKPSWTLSPQKQGGVTQWTTEGIFCFDESPAKQYMLENRLKKLFL
jgi:hypothetical protein